MDEKIYRCELTVEYNGSSIFEEEISLGYAPIRSSRTIR